MKVHEVFKEEWPKRANPESRQKIARCADLLRDHGATYEKTIEIFEGWAGVPIHVSELDEIFYEADHLAQY